MAGWPVHDVPGCATFPAHATPCPDRETNSLSLQPEHGMRMPALGVYLYLMPIHCLAWKSLHVVSCTLKDGTRSPTPAAGHRTPIRCGRFRETWLSHWGEWQEYAAVWYEHATHDDLVQVS